MDNNKLPVGDKKYDLDERTENFAKSVRSFLKNIMRSRSNIEDGKQLIRSSASVAVNYIEASEALSKKDFIYRIKISRKEAKESALFLRLLDTYGHEMLEVEKESLIREAIELKKIFGSIVVKSEYNN